jgi:hypothetical protein
VTKATWTDSVVTFLLASLPGDSRQGWDHRYITAYQIGCEALAALGYAKETDWGAVALPAPVTPPSMPRWDDVSTTLLKLAYQNGTIRYGQDDDGDWQPLFSDGGDLSETVTSPKGLADVSMTVEVVDVLRRVGIVRGNEWTQAAETSLWRAAPGNWTGDFSAEDRFVAAAVAAVDEMPDDIRSEFHRLLTVNADDVAEWRRISAEHSGDLKRQFGSRAILMRPERSDEEVRRTLHRLRVSDFDWLFYERWRLEDGWLSVDEAGRALAVFNDPLAMKMREAVVSRFCALHMPDSELDPGGIQTAPQP